MKNSFAFSILASALFALPLLVSAPAYAGIEACRNIDVDASAKCDVRVQGCDVNCTPVTVEAACAAKLQLDCDASCPQVPSLDCTASCDLDCNAECNVKPAEFDCTASCKADADAHCTAQCASNANKGECAASCRATFAAQCDASCHGTPPSADCKAKCEGRCSGSCTAQTRLQCQVDCQGNGYASCKATVEGGCKADCSNAQGALFCEGEYIDHEGTVDQCIQALKDALPTVTVDASARGDSSCTGSSCMANGEAQASASCAFSPAASDSGLFGAFTVVALFGAACMRRRRAA